MRFIKILLTLCALFLIGVVIYSVFYNFFYAQYKRLENEQIINLSVAFLFSLLAVLYHIKSYHLYSNKKREGQQKNIPKILWIGTLCFSAYFFYLAGKGLHAMLTYGQQDYGFLDILLLSAIAAPGFLGFLEASLTKKRIHKLRTENDVVEEIDSIGDFRS